jgi:hypothetical protein
VVHTEDFLLHLQKRTAPLLEISAEFVALLVDILPEDDLPDIMQQGGGEEPGILAP